MTYKEEITAYIKNLEGNLTKEYSEDLSNGGFAFAEAMELATSDEYNHKILSVIIYHQIAIELMKRLLIYCNFLERISLYPNKIFFKNISKENKYSEILISLKFKVEFKGKKKFIENLTILNKLRNEYPHAFIESDLVQDNKIESNNLYELYNSLFELYANGTRDLKQKIEEIIISRKLKEKFNIDE